MASKNEFDYEKLLKRARDGLPSTIEKHERFQLPEVELLVEGKNTVFRNFGDIIDTIHREPNHLLQFLLRELGTAGELDGRRVIFKGNIGQRQVEERLKSYLDTFVICSECKRPDTQLVKEGRTLVLACTACGAHRSIKSKKAISSHKSKEGFQVGESYHLLIIDVGKQGDGIAKKDDYIIFVPNSNKGEQVRVEVMKISGNKVFAKKLES
jgi:translation initiation factor 2 subunit 2